MIISSIDNIKSSDYTSKNLKTAIEFMKNTDLLNLPIGKTEIDGKNVYVNRSSYVAKNFEDTVLEGHDHYADIQLVLKGKEKIGYIDKSSSGIEVKIPYNSEKDVTKYISKDLDGIITLNPGFFAIVFPEDLHQPVIKVNDEVVEKVVIKVKID